MRCLAHFQQVWIVADVQVEHPDITLSLIRSKKVGHAALVSRRVLQLLLAASRISANTAPSLKQSKTMEIHVALKAK